MRQVVAYRRWSHMEVRLSMIDKDLEKRRIQTFFMMHCKRTVTTVQCGHKRIFCYWMSWLRERLNRIWPWKKTSLIKHFMWLWKREKAPKLFTIFPDFNPIFQTFYRSGKLVCKLQDFFKNLYWRLWLKKLCHNEIYQNSNVGYRHQIERNINEK